MNIHIDLLIPSFAFPIEEAGLDPKNAFGITDHALLDIKARCMGMFGVTDREVIELFPLPRRLSESPPSSSPSSYHTPSSFGAMHIGCLIHGSGLNLDIITHTMCQNKALHDALNKTTDAVLIFQQQREKDLENLLELRSELNGLTSYNKDLQQEMKELKILTLEDVQPNQTTSIPPPPPPPPHNKRQQPHIYKNTRGYRRNSKVFHTNFVNSNEGITGTSLSNSNGSNDTTLINNTTINNPNNNNTANIDSDFVVNENMKKKLMNLAKEVPYYAYNSPPSSARPQSGRPVPPSAPRPVTNTSSPRRNIVLSRSNPRQSSESNLLSNDNLKDSDGLKWDLHVTPLRNSNSARGRREGNV